MSRRFPYVKREVMSVDVVITDDLLLMSYGSRNHKAEPAKDDVIQVHVWVTS